jgi:hypothetical protein
MNESTKTAKLEAEVRQLREIVRQLKLLVRYAEKAGK